jgi:Sulfotransferase domain
MQIVTKMFKIRTRQKILKSLDMFSDMFSDDIVLDQAYWEAQKNHPLCIGIFGTPKSGSTFVWRVLLDLAGAPESRSTLDQTKNHRGVHELDVNDIIRQRLRHGKWISHSHITANPYTLNIIDRLQIMSIVTVRNLLDFIVSLREEWLRQWKTPSVLCDASGSVQFVGLIPSESVQHFMSSDPRAQLDFVIETTCEWYFRNVQGWRNAARVRPERVCFSVYEDLIQDEVVQLHRLSQFAGLDQPIERTMHACTNVKRDTNVANINVGRRGRGRETLTPRQIDRVHSILDAVGADKELTRYLVDGIAAPTLFNS